MQVKNSYFWFKEALTPDECQRIIDQGNAQIDASKQAGKDVSASHHLTSTVHVIYFIPINS